MKKVSKIIILIGLILIISGIGFLIVNKNIEKDDMDSDNTQTKSEIKDDNKNDEEGEDIGKKGKEEDVDPYAYLLNRDSSKINECIDNYANGNKKDIEINYNDKTVTIPYLSCGNEEKLDNGVKIKFNDLLISTFTITKSSREEYKKILMEELKTAFYPFHSKIYGNFETAQKNCIVQMMNEGKIVDANYYYIYEIDSEYVLLVNIDSAIQLEDGFYETIIKSIKILDK